MRLPLDDEIPCGLDVDDYCNKSPTPKSIPCCRQREHIPENVHVGTWEGLVGIRWGEPPRTVPGKGRFPATTSRVIPENCPKCGARWSISVAGPYCQNCGIAMGGAPDDG